MFFVIWGEHTILSQIAQRETSLDYFMRPPPPLHYHSASSMELSHNIYLIALDKSSDAVVAAAAVCDRAAFPADDFAFDLALSLRCGSA